MKPIVLRSSIALVSMLLASAICIAQKTNLPQMAQDAYERHSYAEGAGLFLLAAQIDPDRAAGHIYNAACCYALSGLKDLAYSSLEIAVTKGWRNRQHTESDEDFVSLRSESRWHDILETISPSAGYPRVHRDDIINDLNNLAAVAFQYRIRPGSMGGGEGSYSGFKIPPKMLTNSNASYETVIVQANLVRFRAMSAKGLGTVEASIDQDGKLSDWMYDGKFADPPKEKTGTSVIVSNRDALINQMNDIAAICYQYRIRPKIMGGGQGAYTGVKLPEKLATSDEGTFAITDVEADVLKIQAVSKKVKGSITTTLDRDGRMGSWTYYGELQ
jgi:hypothetical protein